MSAQQAHEQRANEQRALARNTFFWLSFSAAIPQQHESVVLTEEQKRKPIWEILEEILPPIPPEELDRVPEKAS